MISLRAVGGAIVGAEVLDRETGVAVSVAARAAVNATGPWVDHVRRLEDPGRAAVREALEGRARARAAAAGLVGRAHDPTGRRPGQLRRSWAGSLLLGTTDEPYDGDPSDVGVEPADVARVLDEASVGVEREVLDPGRVRASFAGLRVLPGLSGETLTARRETHTSSAAAAC